MPSTELPGLLLDIEDGLATLTLNTPERLNAVTASGFDSLLSATQEVGKPKHRVRAVLLRGDGRAFCSGLDLKARGVGGPPAGLAEGSINPLMRRLRHLHCPVVAAVQGPCVGIGVAFALSADFVVAAEDAYFLLPYRNLGVSLDGGTSWLLPRLVGWARARRMLMLAERVGAETALEWGMIHSVVPLAALPNAAAQLAGELAEGPTVALGVMRRQFWQSWHNGFDEHLEFELRANQRAMRSKDAGIALAARRTGEPPAFLGE